MGRVRRFPSRGAGSGRDNRRAAEADGVFGVPTFILDREMFWGGEHLPDIFEMLSGKRI